MPHRFDRAILGVISGAASPSAPARDGRGRRAARPPRGEAGAALHAALRSRHPLDPGYIKGYPPGIRENGGQYTHAALWSVIAFAALGEGDKAAELFSHAQPDQPREHGADVQRYKVEPYAVAADVYSVAAARGPRRLDLVHGLGRLALPRRARNGKALAEARVPLADDGAVHEVRVVLG
jgi:hypothetical protein